MSHGLQLWNANGESKLIVSDRVLRVAGSYSETRSLGHIGGGIETNLVTTINIPFDGISGNGLWHVLVKNSNVYYTTDTGYSYTDELATYTFTLTPNNISMNIIANVHAATVNIAYTLIILKG